MMESYIGIICIPDVSAKAFKVLLKYIYMEDFEIEKNIAEELFKLCHKYMLKNLKKDCEKVLIRNIKKENAFNYAMLAEKYESGELQKACLYFIAKNMGYSNPQGFIEFGPRTLIELIQQKKMKKK